MESPSIPSVEFWDCSGDLLYEACWPAIQKDTAAVILVVNVDVKKQLGQIPGFINWFVSGNQFSQIKLRNCLVLAISFDETETNLEAFALDNSKNVFILKARAKDHQKIRKGITQFISEVLSKPK